MNSRLLAAVFTIFLGFSLQGPYRAYSDDSFTGRWEGIEEVRLGHDQRVEFSLSIEGQTVIGTVPLGTMTVADTHGTLIKKEASAPIAGEWINGKLILRYSPCRTCWVTYSVSLANGRLVGRYTRQIGLGKAIEGRFHATKVN